MGIREFDAWIETTVRQADRQSSPDSWEGDNSWFDAAHRARG